MMRKSSGNIYVKIEKLNSSKEAEECARFMVKSEPWITLRRTYKQALKMLSDSSREVYLGLVKDQIAGFIILIMRGALVGYIQTVAVKPEWRNKGIGKKLMEFAEDRIFSQTSNVFLCVSSFNRDAQRLYQRLGYEVIGELKDYRVPGHSEILLRKTIGPITEFKNRKKTDKPQNP